ISCAANSLKYKAFNNGLGLLSKAQVQAGKDVKLNGSALFTLYDLHVFSWPIDDLSGSAASGAGLLRGEPRLETLCQWLRPARAGQAIAAEIPLPVRELQHGELANQRPRVKSL